MAARTGDGPPQYPSHYSPLLIKLLELLRELGPMSARDLAEQADGRPINQMAAVLKLAMGAHVKVSSYAISSSSLRRYPVAVYCYGSGPNAERPPKRPKAEVVREWRARRIDAGRARVAPSIWQTNPLVLQRIGLSLREPR